MIPREELLRRRERARAGLRRQRAVAAVAALAAMILSAIVVSVAFGGGGIEVSSISPTPEKLSADVPQQDNPTPQRDNPTMERLVTTPPEKIVRFDDARMTALWAELLLRARARGWSGSVNGPVSGLRTRREQTRLWRCFQRGACPPAFSPSGPSRHLITNERVSGAWSQAADVSHPLELIRIAARIGASLHQPYPSEPWHIEALYPFTLH